MGERLDQTIEKVQEELDDKQGQSSRQLPVGIGGEKLKEGREILPAVEVDNEVSWVNNKMNLPFDLKVGRQSPLGMFLTPNPQEGEKTFNLGVSGFHTRSGILGRVIFSDKEGRLYRDIDLKGMGYIRVGIDREVSVGPVIGSYGERSGEESEFSAFKGTTGIANSEFIRRDINYSEKFLKAGIRTHRVIAILELKEIIDTEGKRISIDEAREKEMLSKEDEPIIEVRAFGIRSRIFDVVGDLRSGKSGKVEKAKKFLTDAKYLVAQELKIEPDKFTYNDYFEWLIKTTAINIARMHYNKWVSGYITHHNITLDGRIVDLDSVETESEAAKRTMDLEDVYSPPKTIEKDRLNTADVLYDFLEYIERGEIYSFRESHKNKSFYNHFDEIYENELQRLKKEKVPKVRN